MGAGLWPPRVTLGARGWLYVGLCHWCWLGCIVGGMVVVMTDKEAMTMKLALEALETLMIERGSIYEKAITALKERLAQPADPTGQAPCVRHCEAMAFQIVIKNLRGEIECLKAPQRTEPPQKKVWTFWDLSGGDITDAIKAKIKEKNA
jgi:hypothetical protein